MRSGSKEPSEEDKEKFYEPGRAQQEKVLEKKGKARLKILRLKNC